MPATWACSLEELVRYGNGLGSHLVGMGVQDTSWTWAQAWGALSVEAISPILFFCYFTSGILGENVQERGPPIFIETSLCLIIKSRLE